MSSNYGFIGDVPSGVSIESNVQIALAYQATHTVSETAMWFYEHVRNNSDGHLSSSESMNYKQIKSPGVDYADFGNFNYGVVGKALGFSDFALEFGAGVAQGRADGRTYAGAIARSTADPFDFGDNPGDQDLIKDRISAAKSAGIAKEGLTLQDFLTSSLTDFFEVMGGVSGILDSAYDFWFGSRSWFQRRDPLTLDLDGDGLETLGIDTGRLVYFDHNGDGVKTATGWVSSDDGFLVLDRNGNGTIDSGAELFGDSTALADGSTATDGFAALAEQDTNGDGVVNQNDSGWGDLRVWRDLNQNGISEAGELQTLNDIGIASLDVGAQSHSQVLADGNRLADLGRFTWATGEVGEIESTTGQRGDIDLAENSFYRQFTDPVPLTAEAQALPEMHGSGALRDMREAASLSPVLLPKRHITYGMTIDDPRDEFPIRSTVPTCRQIDVISGNSHTAKRNHPVFPGGWKRAAELGMQGSMTLPH